MFSPSEEIKQRIDIVDFIREYLKLQKSGSSWRALCPFHHEKTPSFFVSEDKQIWHCFGCGKGGDVFGFLMEMEGMEFPEALRILAKRAGVKLERRDPALENQKTRLLDILKLATDFFQKALYQNQAVLNYLKERKIKEETIEDWKLGYSYNDWEQLNNFLKDKGYSEEEIFQAGLTVKKEKGVGYYDRFRNRLMFPIADPHGNIVGFTARKLEEKEEGGKYINSPQSMVYNKSYILYGLDKAKQHIKKLGAAIVVEGNIDALMAHQTGWKNVAASSGTALTEEQIRLLKRYSQNLLFAFDMDLAGSEAAKRGIEVALQEEMNIKIVQLPEKYKDPDDCLKDEPEVFRQAVKQAKNILDYYFAIALKDLDLKNVDDKKKAARTLLPILAKVRNTIEQTHYLQKLADLINVPVGILRARLPRPEQKPVEGKKESIAKKDKGDLLTERALALLFASPKEIRYFAENLELEFLKEQRQPLYRKIISFYNQHGELPKEEFLKVYPEEREQVGFLCLYIEAKLKDWPQKTIHEEIIKTIQLLERESLRQRLTDLEKEIKETESINDVDKMNELISEFDLILQKLKALS